MAIKVGKESVEGSFKLYMGIGAFNIIAVNPNKKELESILGRELDKDPEYIGKTEDGKDTIRVTFYAKTNKDSKVNNGIELVTPISFTITKAVRVGANTGKTMIIDKYGRTAWATQEELSSKSIPIYSSGPANIDKDYRPCCVGEDSLIDFLIQWLNIPNPAEYKEGKWIMKKDPSDSEVSLDLNKLFKNDMSELKEVIKIAGAFLVKGAVGIRTTDEGKQYQSVFTRKFVKNAVTDYSRLDAAIKDFQNNGGASNTEFNCTPLHEYVVESTDFSKESSSDLPFESEDTTPWFGK